MTIYSDSLKERPFETVSAPLNVFCSDSKCNGLIRTGEPVKKYDGATFTHIVCAEGKPRHTAAHKYPNTGLNLGTKLDLEAGICSCGNKFDGDNFCMPSACQWEE